MRSTTAARRVSAAPDVLDAVRALVSLIFVVLVPFLLFSTSLRALVTDRALILRGFQENRVDLTTGLDEPQLERIADAFVAYFQAPAGPLQMQIHVYGQTRPLFNDREGQHMEDVQALIQLFLRLQLVALAVVVVRVVLAVGLDRSTVPMGRELLWSAGLGGALVALVGVLSLIDFTELWTRFHQIAFRNDLWQLDPSRDYLIMLFPEPFWYAATMRMATSVAVQTILVAMLGVACLLSPRLFG